MLVSRQLRGNRGKAPFKVREMMAEKSHPSLALKKDLIIHTYDLFLIAQTRLFIQTTSNEEADSAEINRRRELLLLDDLIGFAIAARRLVELTGLKSFANRCMVPVAYLDQSEEPYCVMKSKTNVGFHTLMNRLIHASMIEHIKNKIEYVLFFTPLAEETPDKIFRNYLLHKNAKRHPIEQLLFVSSDDGDPVLISIKDLIDQSTKVADKLSIRATARRFGWKLVSEISDRRGAERWQTRHYGP